jgi:predicted nucleic acid-binding protein
MPRKCFVDTNILIYAHDATAGSKHVRSRELVEHLWNAQEGVLSTQVLQELCVNLRRKLATPLPINDVRQLIRDYSNWEIVVNTADSVMHALELEARHRISFWDALILQAAERADVDVLYSEGLASGQHFGSIKIVNPFLS